MVKDKKPPVELPPFLNPDNWVNVRCSGCGRFLGKAYMNGSAVALYYCREKECKRYSVVCGEEAEKVLTGKDLEPIIAAR